MQSQRPKKDFSVKRLVVYGILSIGFLCAAEAAGKLLGNTMVNGVFDLSSLGKSPTSKPEATGHELDAQSIKR